MLSPETHSRRTSALRSALGPLTPFLTDDRVVEILLNPDGCVWVVYPKSRHGFRETDVLAAGRAAGLKDVKTARFSATHSALKFVVPLSER